MAKRQRHAADPEQIATVLVEAEFFGDKVTAKAHSVAARTIRTWRKTRQSEPAISALILEKRNLIREKLGKRMIGTFIRGVDKMAELIEAAKPSAEPGVLREVAGAVKVLGELHTVREMMGSGVEPGVDREDPTSEEASGGAPGSPASSIH